MSAGTPDLRFWRRRRVPLVLQSEAAECGLSCLAMIASYYGKRMELSTLRQQYAASLQGTNLTRLLQLAETLSLASRPVRADLGELKHLHLPCLLHWNLDHFVVLEKLGRHSAVVIDPALGRRRVRRRELSRRFSGVAVEFTPAPSFETGKATSRLRFRQLVADARGLLAALAMVFVLSLTLQVLALLLPFYSQLVIDDVVLSGDRGLLTLLAVACGLLILMQTAISMLRSWVVVTLSTRFNLQLAGRVFSHLIRLPLSFFEKRHLGDVQSRFSAAAALQQLITRQFVEAAVDGLMAVTTLCVMFAYDYRLAGVVLASVTAYFVARAFMVPSLHGASQEAQVLAASRDSHFLESVRGLLAIKTSCQEWQRDLGYQNRLAEAWNPVIRGNRLQIWQLGINQLLFGLQFVVVVWLAALAILDGRFTTGMLVAFLAYRALFTERAAALIDRLLEFRLARVLLDRLADIVQTDREPAYSFAAGNVQRMDARLSLRASNLRFRYAEGDADILKAISFDIRAGEHVVLTGPSGCGKTTLIKILMGLLEPASGSVDINGHHLCRYGVLRYRRQIAAVMQEDRLFCGSILDNISFFDVNVDVSRAKACARFADLAAYIERLPMQYFSVVGDMGTALSGGQRQRLLLARALYRRPRILFLDEFTSHLDAASEARINARLRRLAITRVVVAHRVETIRHADRQIRLSGGSISY